MAAFLTQPASVGLLEFQPGIGRKLEFLIGLNFNQPTTQMESLYMDTDSTPKYTVRATRLTSLAALLAVVAGAMVLLGWAFDIAALKGILPGRVACGIRAICEHGER